MKLAALALAAVSIIAYSATSVHQVKPDVYTMQTTAGMDQNGKFYDTKKPSQLTVTTVGCKHAPGPGASAIILIMPDKRVIQFSDGPSCPIAEIQ